MRESDGRRSSALVGVRRCITMVDGQQVPVRVLKERLQANARVDRLASELDAARLEFPMSLLEVLDAQLEGMVVRLELHPEGVRLQDCDRQVAGLELGRGHLTPPLGERQDEDAVIEVARGIEIP